MRKFLAIALLAIPLVGFSQETQREQSGQAGQPGQTEQMGQSGQQKDQAKDQAKVLFINSIPGAEAVNVVAQGQPLFTNVQFGKASEVKSMPAKDLKFDITSTDGKQVFARNHDLDLSANQTVTIVATARMTDEGQRKVHTAIIENDPSKLGADKTNVALVNGTPMGRDLTLRVDGKEVISGVGALSHKTSRDIAPGAHKVEIASGDRGTIAGPMQVNFTPGRAFTIVASGSQMMGGAAPGTAPGGQREPGTREPQAGQPGAAAGQITVAIFDDNGTQVNTPGGAAGSQMQGQQQPGQTQGQQPGQEPGQTHQGQQPSQEPGQSGTSPSTGSSGSTNQ